LSHITAFYVVPEFGNLIRRFKVLRVGHPLLEGGKRLESLSQFCDVARAVMTNWRPQDEFDIVGDVVLSRRSSIVTMGRKRFQLPDVAAAMFKLLVCNAGNVVSPEALRKVAQVASRQRSEPHLCFNEFYVRNCISVLRKRLGQFANRILTIKCEGYMYVDGSSEQRPSNNEKKSERRTRA
jgi:DNA-binding winged helix-turn-helix (wHTH) protein